MFLADLVHHVVRVGLGLNGSDQTYMLGHIPSQVGLVSLLDIVHIAPSVLTRFRHQFWARPCTVGGQMEMR